jgi:hypothetical protein
MTRRYRPRWSHPLLAQACLLSAGCMTAETLRDRAEQEAEKFCDQQGKKLYITESYVTEHLDYLSSHIQYVCVGKDSDLYWHPGLQIVLEPWRDPPGARVLHFMPDSAARHAGLRQGDVIQAVDEHRVLGPTDVLRWTDGLTTDTTVTIHIMRNSLPLSVHVPL